ncbi:MAG: prepilin-type N-terminal cleavage/methylation domain-containing protein [Candidatus Marinimicrobia bacterium]|nr:prepilin-type N-terminal cleavage/methylation domain-containing protein [Candidatus Neomarinimicrobiota bacterium]
MKRGAGQGFTLLELLVAITLLATVLGIVAATFHVAVTAWRRGEALVDRIHQGDYVIEHLVGALRSAVFFESAAHRYGFWLEEGGLEGARFSWVTASGALMPPNRPGLAGVQRLRVAAAGGARDEGGLACEAWPHLTDEDAIEIETWTLAPDVEELGCRVYDFEREAWADTWENTNSLPRLIELTVYLAPIESGAERIRLQRVIEIPVALAAERGVAARGDEPRRRSRGRTNQSPSPAPQDPGPQERSAPE